VTPTIRFLHLASTALFLGNIAATLAWKMYAERTQDSRLVAFSLQTALFTDKLITVPCAVVVTVSGIVLLVIGKPGLLLQSWLQLSIALWVASAVAAICYLVPSLQKLHKMAEGRAAMSNLDQSYFVAARRWNIASGLLIVSPMVIFLLAVCQPELW
jgi:uncharacterized membrane protein